MALSPMSANSPNMANGRIQTLQFDNVIYTTPKKAEILHSVCGKIKAGHVTAIMGPSGAGKTTLFNCLSGRVGKESWSGRVTINGREISRAALRKAVAVVTQTDTMYETATPREIFATNLKLRSPTRLPAEQIKATVQGIVERLQLTACADTRVGTPGLVRGLSGGERKRTNIGSEIINDPSIILLDEPTTGLDSVSALKVMQLLHSLAHQDGRAIVLTIHQPSSEIFELIDDLFLLVEGSIVYGGPADQVLGHFEQLGHPSPLHYNPADHIIEVLEEEANERAGTGRQSKFVEAWNTMNATTVAVNEYAEAAGEEPDSRVSAPFLVQFPTLIVRAWRNIVRDKKTLMGMFIQNFFFLLLVLLIYWNLDETRDGIQDRQGLFLMLCANCLFGNTTPACAAFARERAIFIREQQTASYSTTLYLLTKIVAEAPFRVLIPVITTSIMYGPLTLAQTAKGYFLYAAILALLGFTGTGLGMFVAAITPDLQVATAIIPLILVPMFLGAGLIVSAERLRGFWTWMKYYSLMRYGNTVLLKNEFGQIGCIKCDDAAITCTMNDSSCLNTGAKVLEYLKLENDHIWLQFVILGCVAVASIVFANFGLMLMARRKRSA